MRTLKLNFNKLLIGLSLISAFSVVPVLVSHVHAQSNSEAMKQEMTNGAQKSASIDSDSQTQVDTLNDDSVKPFEQFSLEPMVRTGKVVTVSDTVSHDLFVAGESVDISGIIDGDLYVAAQNVKITGTVTGSVFSAGQSIHMAGTVENGFKAAGQTVIVSGKVGRSVLGAAQTFTVAETATVGGSVSVAAQSVALDTAIPGSLLAGGQQLNLNGPVDGPIKAAAETLFLGQRAMINNNLDYLSAQPLQGNLSAAHRGKIQRYQPSEEQMERLSNQQQSLKKDSFSQHAARGVLGAGLVFAALQLLIMCLIGAIALKISPAKLRQADQNLRQTSLMVFAKGFAAILLLPVVAIMLMITIVGFPLGLITLAGWFTLMYFSSIPVALSIGSSVFNRTGQKRNTHFPIFELVTGLVILSLIGFIPVVNVVVGALVLFLGVGMWLPGSKESKTSVPAKKAAQRAK